MKAPTALTSNSGLPFMRTADPIGTGASLGPLVRFIHSSMRSPLVAYTLRLSSAFQIAPRDRLVACTATRPPVIAILLVRSTSHVAQDEEYKSGVTGRLCAFRSAGGGRKNRFASGFPSRSSKMEFHRATSL